MPKVIVQHNLPYKILDGMEISERTYEILKRLQKRGVMFLEFNDGPEEDDKTYKEIRQIASDNDITFLLPVQGGDYIQAGPERDRYVYLIVCNHYANWFK